jgi:hypothetical protein
MCRHAVNEFPRAPMDLLVGQFINSTVKLVYTIKGSTINEDYTTFDSSRARPIETPAFCPSERNK